jgi:hypothetical protein
MTTGAEVGPGHPRHGGIDGHESDGRQGAGTDKADEKPTTAAMPGNLVHVHIVLL